MLKKKRNQAVLTGILLAALVLSAFFAQKFSFYVYGEEELHTTVSQFFSIEHLWRLSPFILILSASFLGIGGILLALKSLPARRHPGRNRFRSRAGRGEKLTAGKTPGFMKARWLILIGFSLLIMFGGILSGVIVPGFALPVLSCPTNRDQFIESSCYFLSHLPVLFEEYTAGGIALFFLSTIGSALLLGRMICGFLCPMGLIQDVMHLARQKTKAPGLPEKASLYQTLAVLKWGILLLMFGLVFAGGEFCSFCPAIAVSPVLAGMKVSLYFSGFFMILVLIGSFFKRRIWCNICPLGYLIGLVSRFSPFRLKKNTTSCTECGACYEACPMGIKGIYMEREKSDVTEVNCILCGECVRRCPEDDGLSICFAGKKLYTASRAQVMSGFED